MTDTKNEQNNAYTGGTCDEPRTLLRIINGAGFARFSFSVDGHRMRVVGIDGLAVFPSEVCVGVYSQTSMD